MNRLQELAGINELGINKPSEKDQIVKMLQKIIDLINQIPTPSNIDLEGINDDLRNHIFELNNIEQFEYYNEYE